MTAANQGILGKWVSQDGKVSAELKSAENNEYKLTYTNEDGKTGAFRVRFGKIGNSDVAEACADAFTADSSGEYQSLLLPMYTVLVIQKQTPGQLVLTAVSTEWFKKYMQANPDELNVMSIGGQDLIVNSSTDDYQKFLVRHVGDKEMLGDGSVFVRAGDPTTQPAGDKAADKGAAAKP